MAQRKVRTGSSCSQQRCCVGTPSTGNALLSAKVILILYTGSFNPCPPPTVFLKAWFASLHRGFLFLLPPCSMQKPRINAIRHPGCGWLSLLSLPLMMSRSQTGHLSPPHTAWSYRRRDNKIPCATKTSAASQLNQRWGWRWNLLFITFRTEEKVREKHGKSILLEILIGKEIYKQAILLVISTSVNPSAMTDCSWPPLTRFNSGTSMWICSFKHLQELPLHPNVLM